MNAVERNLPSAAAPASDEPDDESAAAAPSRHPALLRLIQIGRIAIVIAVIAAIVYAAMREWDQVSETIASLSWQALTLAIASIVAGMFCSVKVWQHLLAALGTHVAYFRAVQINLVGQLGKYLPGSVWSFVLQAELGRRYAVPRARSVVALVLSAGLTIATALTISVFSIDALLDQWGGIAWLLAAGPLSLIIVIPPVTTFVANTFLKLMRRPRLAEPVDGRNLLWAAVWSVTSWAFFGIHLWALASSLGLQPWSGYVLATAAFALAMSAGFVAFILPSGVGVREAVIVAALSPILPAGPALAFALTSRLLFTVADVLSALLAIAAARLWAPAESTDVVSSDDGPATKASLT